MPLPLSPPVLPQLARPGAELPDGEGWLYEPKWDGFRAIAFVDGDDFHVQSRNGKPLNRYFPEVTMPPGRYVLDGELVVAGADGREQFETLQQRIHPAESRIARLAAETPAELRSFDLLAWDGESLLDRPFAERRRILEQHFEPVKRTERVEDAEGWIESPDTTWIFSYQNICDVLGIDAAYLRKGLRVWKAKAGGDRGRVLAFPDDDIDPRTIETARNAGLN